MTFEDDLLALEARVLEEAGGDFFRAVADLRRMLAAETGGAARRLEELAIPRLGNEAALAANDAWDLGGQRALDSAQERGVDANTLNDADLRLVGRPTHLNDPFIDLDTLLVDAKTRAVALLRSGADAQTASAPIFQAATTARARIVTQVNAASNAAALEVGDATRSPMVWEAERDACVYCLALAGEVVEQAGDLFPAADLYAPAPKTMTAGSSPPLHPHCRCRLVVLVDQSYADALKREAQRSILRGHSLASESQAVRVRAAARLLERDPVAPKTVKAFAAAAVKRGHFPTRDVPKGDPRLIILGKGEAGPLDRRSSGGPAPKAPPADVRGGARPPFDPKDPLAHYGNVFIREDDSDIAKEHARQLAEHVSPGVHVLLRDHFAEHAHHDHAGIYVGEKAMPELDEQGHLRGVQPRGWPPGKTWDVVPGAYNPAERVVLLGGGEGNDHGSDSLALHESAHAVDDALGRAFSGGLARNLSDSNDFFEVANRMANASPDYGYFSRRDNPSGWTSELFAESYALFMRHRGAGNIHEEIAEHVHQSTGFDTKHHSERDRLAKMVETARDLVSYFEKMEEAADKVARSRGGLR